MSLDFSSASDVVNHTAVLFKLRSIGIDDSSTDISSHFLSERHQRIATDGYYSKLHMVSLILLRAVFLGSFFFVK